MLSGHARYWGFSLRSAFYSNLAAVKRSLDIRWVSEPFVTNSCVQDVLPLRGFCFFTIMEIVFAPDNRRKSIKSIKTLKKPAFCVRFAGRIWSYKKYSIFEKVKTQVTMVTKIMIFSIIITLSVHILGVNAFFAKSENTKSHCWAGPKYPKYYEKVSFLFFCTFFVQYFKNTPLCGFLKVGKSVIFGGFSEKSWNSWDFEI